MAIAGQLNQDFTTTAVTTTDGNRLIAIYSDKAFPSGITNGAQQNTFDVVGVDFDNNEIVSCKFVIKLIMTDGIVSMVDKAIFLDPIATSSSPALHETNVVPSVNDGYVIVRALGATDRTIYWSCNRLPELNVLDNWTASPTPTDGYIPVWRSATSRIEFETGAPVDVIYSGPAGGDLSGNYPNPTVAKINAATVPLAGTLTIGNALKVTGASSVNYSAINLAGGSAHVAGMLPAANITTMVGDTTGVIDNNTVVKINGASVPASGSLTTGNSLGVTGVAALTYSAVNLAGGINYVTGTLGIANLPTLLFTQTFTSNDTWVCPADITVVILEGYGGGGGGSNAANQGSGGGGSSVVYSSVAVTPGASYSVVIGAGGAGGGSGAEAPGTDGYDTTFGTLYVAKGAERGGDNPGSSTVSTGGLTCRNSNKNTTSSSLYSATYGPGCGGGSQSLGIAIKGFSQPQGYGFTGGAAGALLGSQLPGCGGGQGPGGSGGAGGYGSINSPGALGENGYSAAANTGAGGGGGGLDRTGTGTASGGAGGSGKLTVIWIGA